jgi:hypothetical protein
MRQDEFERQLRTAITLYRATRTRSAGDSQFERRLDWLTLHCSGEQWVDVERTLQASRRADHEVAEREDPPAPDLAEIASPAISALEAARITSLTTALGAALTIIEE